jgi:hypothetical protein
MANPDRPRGFTAVKTKSGGPVTGAIRAVFSLAADRSSDSTNNHGDIYIGDPIGIDTSGVVTPADSNEAVAGVACGFAKAGTITFGANGIVNTPAPPFNPADLTERYLPYTSAGWVYYYDAKDVIFEVQSASDLDLLVGSLADTNMAAATAHGSRTTGRSNVELTTASDNDVKVVEIPSYENNDTTAANCRYWVEFFIQNFAPNNAT